MILEDFHVHSNFSDGKNSPEDIVRAAIDLGMKKIGFSDHIYTDFDEDYCIPLSEIENYKAEVSSLKEKYKSKINIFLGIETDYFSNYPTDGFDYVIGSVHYVYKNNKFFSVDHTKDITIDFVNSIYEGDFYAYSEDYYKCVSDVVNKTKCDIIGHFDLITKFNEDNLLFDANDAKYFDVAKKTINNLVKFNKPFEINTGAISRGYRTFPYPDFPLLSYIKERGGRVILSSDSHSKDTLCYKFNEYEKLVKELGFCEYLFKI